MTEEEIFTQEIAGKIHLALQTCKGSELQGLCRMLKGMMDTEKFTALMDYHEIAEEV